MIPSSRSIIRSHTWAGSPSSAYAASNARWDGIRGLEGLGHVAAERGGRSRVPLVVQVAHERVEERRARHRRGYPCVLGRVGVVGLQRGRVAAAEHGLELAELRRLEAAGGLQPIAEGQELARVIVSSTSSCPTTVLRIVSMRLSA